jgi:hypothetical protein
MNFKEECSNNSFEASVEGDSKLSANARKQRRKRRKVTKECGRDFRMNGRPACCDNTSSQAICNKIVVDADQGIFHDVKWLQEIVCGLLLF